MLKFTKFGKDSWGLRSVRNNSVLKTKGQKQSLISIDLLNGELGINFGLDKKKIKTAEKKKELFG